LLDISYGGFRLELGSGSVALPAVLDVELPDIGVSVKAERVWSRRTDPDPSEAWLCGAALATIDRDSTQRWRGLVDTLQEGSASWSSSRPGL
jgi:hypothetical protein